MTNVHPPVPSIVSSTTGLRDGLTLTVHRPRPGQVLIRAHGEVDLATAGGVRRVLDAAGRGPDPVTRRPPGHLVCDLSGVTFLGAIGVGALAEAGEAARRRGARLQVVTTTRPARRVLELCDLHRELAVTADLSEALDDRRAPARIGESPRRRP